MFNVTSPRLEGSNHANQSIRPQHTRTQRTCVTGNDTAYTLSIDNNQKNLRGKNEKWNVIVIVFFFFKYRVQYCTVKVAACCTSTVYPYSISKSV